jgi:xanthine/uracil/vitamin C permease (AzgA family)
MKRHISQFVAAFTFAIIMCVGFSATAAPPFETNVFNFKNDVSLMGADHTVTAVVMPLFNYPATEVFDDTGTGIVTNANAATTSKNGDNIGMAGFTKSTGKATTFDDTGTNLTRHDAIAAITTTAKDDDIGAMTHFNCSATEVFDDTGTGIVTNVNAATRITRSDQQLDDGSFTAMNMNQTQVVCFNDTGGSMFQDYNMVNDSGNQRLTTFAGNFNSTSNA